MRPQEMTHKYREIIVISVERIPAEWVQWASCEQKKTRPEKKEKESLRGTENLVKWFTQIHLAIFFSPFL